MLENLRKKYPRFIYESFETSFQSGTLNITFSFRVEPDIRFSPRVLINNVQKGEIDSLGKEAIDNFAFHLGMIEMFSYWKATCSPIIEVRSGRLNKERIVWWHSLLIKGMGQFFYENKIDFRKDDFVKIISESSNDMTPKPFKVKGDKLLVPVGGGKDSATSLEIFGKNSKQLGTFSLNPFPASQQVIKIAKVKETVSVQRRIDKKLLELNSKGFLNGHTPFSAYLAFLSTFCAALFNYKHVAFSNERSANEENTKYLGQKINHQYSKTTDFENKFRGYSEEYLSNVNYFSFLRPLYEIQISKIFSRYEKYFEAIRSCNKGQKTNSWCCVCSKCLSTFILLYAFLGPEKIGEVFPQNMFKNIDLFGLMQDLTVEGRVKPFECVGTREELIVGLFLSLGYHNKNKPVLLMRAEKEILGRQRDLEKRTETILKEWDKNNNLGKDFERILKSQL